MQTLQIQSNQLYLDCRILKAKEEPYHSSKAIFISFFPRNVIRKTDKFLFSVLALGLNEYFNLSYVDPVTQQTITCSEDCILSNATYQDFTVLNPLSSNGIRININSWFGSGGGLGYVQIYQSGNYYTHAQTQSIKLNKFYILSHSIDISVHPHLNTNDTQCNPTSSSTQTTVTGNWKDVYVYGYYQTVLVAEVPYTELSTSNTAIVYEP